MFQHTAARRRLRIKYNGKNQKKEFQHTAARRRLPRRATDCHPPTPVSTHSRAEAAAGKSSIAPSNIPGFNTQPRGGGCIFIKGQSNYTLSFNTQPRGGGCNLINRPTPKPTLFQHTAARRRLRDMGPWKTHPKRFNTQPRGGGCSAVMRN